MICKFIQSIYGGNSIYLYNVLIDKLIISSIRERNYAVLPKSDLIFLHINLLIYPSYAYIDPYNIYEMFCIDQRTKEIEKKIHN